MRVEYGPAGQLAAIVDPAGDRIEYSYDIAGRITQVGQRVGVDVANTIDTTYDDSWQKTETEDALGRLTVYDYDGVGQMTKTTFVDSSTVEITYDGIGNIESAKDQAGKLTQYEYDGRARSWRIARIPRGDSWNPKARSPLAAPGLGIAEGDLLLAVDGQAVGARRSPFERLVNQAEREVRLTVQTPGKSRWRVTVKTLGSDTELRYRDWVEGNRERVHRETRGRVGYVHVPDMGPRGFGEFHRYYRNEVLRDGLVVDVRWNGGGHVSQLLLEKLLRKRIAWDLPRWQTPSTYPEDAPAGPMVALTNENAGSDGDVFCHSWKLYGLGPLIGKRTWGGVVGIYPRHALVDGTMTTQAEFSSWFTDVAWAVENYGTDPDIEVDIEPQDHAAGRDTQLDRGLAEIKRILEAHPPQRPKFDRKPKLRPPRLSR